MSLWQVPAVVLAFLGWLNGPVDSLADAARREAFRRQLTPAATRMFTNQDLPAVPRASFVPAPAAAVTTADEPPAAAAAATAPPAATNPAPPAASSSSGGDKKDEAYWHGQMVALREAVERDQVLADALQSRINALTTDFINRDDPAQKAQLFEQRQRAIAELDRQTKQVTADRKAIEDLQELARKQGVPPGWIR